MDHLSSYVEPLKDRKPHRPILPMTFGWAGFIALGFTAPG
jgi:hypothetical protein